MSDGIKEPRPNSPSVEKTYGLSIDEWQSLVRSRLPAKHMEPVAILKADHGTGHGQANAIAANVLVAQKARS